MALRCPAIRHRCGHLPRGLLQDAVSEGNRGGPGGIGTGPASPIDVPADRKRAERVAKYADMFSAMGTEPRLRIMQLLLSAHPEGLVVGDIQGELEIPNSTLSHHLDKLKNEDLVHVQRESTFLRYTANTEALQELLQFLYSECCTRNKALKPQDIVEVCR